MDVRQTLNTLPGQPGVYLMYNEANRVIYVGKAKVLKNRVRSYFQKNQALNSPKVARMVPHIERIETIVTDNEVEALVLEANLIRKYQPRYNTALKNSKGFPYIKISWHHDYPKIQLARSYGKKDKSLFYGPYPSVGAVRSLLEAITQIFPIEKCKDPAKEKRTCIYYDMKRCMGHCVKKVSSEEYKAMLQGVKLFLDGKSDELKDRLKEQMHRYSDKLQFEAAGQVRDTIFALERAIQPARNQKMVSKPHDYFDTIHIARKGNICHLQLFQIREGYLQTPLQDTFLIEPEDQLTDVLAQFLYDYYSHHADRIPKEILLPFDLPDQDIFKAWLESQRKSKVKLKIPLKGMKKRLLDLVQKNVTEGLKKAEVESKWKLIEEGLSELKEVLELEDMPYRIEGFDISHFQGQDTVASMVVFINGKPAKSEYRRFKIHWAEGLPNDFISMQEVISRRYQRLKKESLPEPDLILIDGGKGQVSSAIKACFNIGYHPKGLIGLAKREEQIILPDRSEALCLPRHSSGLKLLQQVRDESHRFALTYHRTLRKKRTIGSELDQIPGIGPKRRQMLLRSFGSLDKIKEANVEALRKIGRVPVEVAYKIYNHFHEGEE